MFDFHAPTIIGTDGTLAITDMLGEGAILLKGAMTTRVDVERDRPLCDITTRDDMVRRYITIDRGFRVNIGLVCPEIVIGGELPDFRNVNDLTVRQLLAEVNQRLLQRQG